MQKTNRRKFIAISTVLATGGPIAALASKNVENKYPIVHHAIFWLKNPGSTDDRDKLVSGVKTLSKIETVHDLRVGIVANTEKRDVVDKSWGVSELMFFSDLAGQAAYQTSPIHLDFIKNYSHLWDKVVVYDAIDV
jgi:Stress responsive A/B Barrel Domain